MCSAAALVRPSFQRRLIQGLNGSSLLSRPVALTSSPAGPAAGEAVHGLPVQAQDLGGLPPGAPGLQQLVHGCVALEGARNQGPLAAAHVPQPVRLRRRRRGQADVREPAGVRFPTPGGLIRGAREAAAVRGDRLLDVLAQVVPQVPAVGDLDRERGAGGGAVSVGAAGPGR